MLHIEGGPMQSFTGKLAVVTGGGTGMGRELTRQLAAEGCDVAICDVSATNMADTLAACATESPDATVTSFVADVSSEAALVAFRDHVTEAHATDHLDLLFNNAGIGAPAVPLEDLPYEQWKAVVDTNLTGSFLCAQAAFRVMKAQTPRGGRIINNGSISAHAPRPDSAPYTASKHAITGLTRTISLDGRKYDIACCQVDVGNAMTELAARMSKGVKQADGSIAVEPMIDVEDVARAVVYMANQPQGVNIYHLMVMATKMPYAGRG
jgi:NAD(P)-dependent dehydrogenase (short-subunit alcohol dehydrogenase family)